MDIVIVLFAFLFTMAEYFVLLWSFRIGIKRVYFISVGLAVLIAIWSIGGNTFGRGSEGYWGVRAAFVSLIFMIGSKRILDKLQNTLLVVLMKNCLLVAVETWFIDADILNDFGTSYLFTFLFYTAELLLIGLLGLVLRVVIKSFDEEKINKAGSFLDYVIFLGCFDVFTCIWWAYVEIGTGHYSSMRDKAITSFGAVSLILLEITILYKKWLAEQVKKYAMADRELYETQKNYFLSLLDKEAETKKYRHDMNNHMICIKSLIEEKNYVELEKYIDNLYDSTSALVNKGYKTGNAVIDALTNYYADRVDGEIEFNISGNIFKSLGLDDVALSSIYSNLLVNAIEAQKTLPKERDRYIQVKLLEGEKYAQISVCNSMQNEIIKDPEHIKTTKDNEENHGFGLSNVKKNVDACHGQMSIVAENYEFCVKVTLPIIKN